MDSTFIAARTELAGVYWNLDDQKNLELTRAAMRRLRPHADHRGQLRIDLQEAVVGDDPPGIVRAASELTQLYPKIASTPTCSVAATTARRSIDAASTRSSRWSTRATAGRTRTS
jgi:hypothetical protein